MELRRALRKFACRTYAGRAQAVRTRARVRWYAEASLKTMDSRHRSTVTCSTRPWADASGTQRQAMRKYLYSFLDDSGHKDWPKACPLCKTNLTVRPQGGGKRSATPTVEASFWAGSAMKKRLRCTGVTSRTTKHISTTATKLQLHSSSTGLTLALVKASLCVVSQVWVCRSVVQLVEVSPISSVSKG